MGYIALLGNAVLSGPVNTVSTPLAGRTTTLAIGSMLRFDGHGSEFDLDPVGKGTIDNDTWVKDANGKFEIAAGTQIAKAEITYADGHKESDIYVSVIYINNTPYIMVQMEPSVQPSLDFIQSPISAKITGPIYYENSVDLYWRNLWNIVKTPEGLKSAGPVCFVKGTLIETANGHERIETLTSNSWVKTLDRGFQRPRWIGHTIFKGDGAHAPIHFKKGAIGNMRALDVSPLHRILLRDWRLGIFLDKAQVLIEARTLVNDKTIYRNPSPWVCYYHILFENHEIIFANGAYSESFCPGPEALGRLPQASRDEIYEILPELQNQDTPEKKIKTAHPTIKNYEARLLFA